VARRNKLLLAAVVAALLTAAPACGDDEAEPVAVAKRFAESARRGDVEAMMAVLERPAIERIEQAAERASDQVGGRRNIEPSEMLQIVGVDRTVAVVDAELIDQDGRVAHVELTTTDGRNVRVELVWEPAEVEEGGEAEGDEGSWKVRVPLPPPASAAKVPSTPDA
jgi:hypothetical protein